MSELTPTLDDTPLTKRPGERVTWVESDSPTSPYEEDE